MALLYPISGGRESQRFGPVPVGVPGRNFQPLMYGNQDRATHAPYAGLPYAGPLHTGLDIAAARGTTIVASEAGEVRIAGWWSNASGNWVRVQIKTGVWYDHVHCDRVLVKAGQKVSRGQPIATVGATGNVTGNHSHFMLVFHEGRFVYQNPKNFLPGGKWANDPRISVAPPPPPPPPPVPSSGGLPVNFTAMTGKTVTINAPVNCRQSPSLTAPIILTTSKPTTFHLWGRTTGAAFSGSTDWYFGPLWISGRWRIVYVHSRVTSNLR